MSSSGTPPEPASRPISDRADAPTRAGRQSSLRLAWRLIWPALDHFVYDKGFIYAGYIAFASLFALFPFLLFLVTLAGFWPLYVQHRRQQDAIAAMGELGPGLGELAAQMNAEMGGPLAHLSIAAWALVATVLYLAFRGIARAISSSA